MFGLVVENGSMVVHEYPIQLWSLAIIHSYLPPRYLTNDFLSRWWQRKISADTSYLVLGRRPRGSSARHRISMRLSSRIAQCLGPRKYT
jgi:hypothetical protein